jgi:transcriptional regulator with XRE-family HTH domain
VAELAPAVEPVVPPSFSSATEAVSAPTWSLDEAESSREADPASPSAAVASGIHRSHVTTPSTAAQSAATEQELESVSVSAASVDRSSGAGTVALQRSIPTVQLAQATATPRAGADLVLGVVGPTAVPLPLAVVAVTPAIGSAAAVAMELARVAGSASIVFNVWLRRQLRERRMSQRQLAAFSGVDHSTISRLLSGARAPSLRTATKLAEALRKLGGPDHAADYFARLSESEPFPTKRVEAALLGDDELQDEDVRELMNAYLMLRTRRRRERLASTENGEDASDVG